MTSFATGVPQNKVRYRVWPEERRRVVPEFSECLRILQPLRTGRRHEGTQVGTKAVFPRSRLWAEVAQNRHYLDGNLVRVNNNKQVRSHPGRPRQAFPASRKRATQPRTFHQGMAVSYLMNIMCGTNVECRTFRIRDALLMARC